MPQYILDDTGEPIEEPDHVKWVDWCKGKWNGVMAQTLFPDGYVSTIFLMSAAEPEDGQAPILFETMIFEGPCVVAVEIFQPPCGDHPSQSGGGRPAGGQTTT